MFADGNMKSYLVVVCSSDFDWTFKQCLFSARPDIAILFFAFVSLFFESYCWLTVAVVIVVDQFGLSVHWIEYILPQTKCFSLDNSFCCLEVESRVNDLYADSTNLSVKSYSKRFETFETKIHSFSGSNFSGILVSVKFSKFKATLFGGHFNECKVLRE